MGNQINNNSMLFRAFKSFARLYILRQRVPIFVLYALTNRCNLRCSYCAFPLLDRDQIPKHRVLASLSEMAENGTVRVGLFGGEPLLRKDIGEIISHAKDLGLMVHLYTNGTVPLIRKHLESIKKTDGVFISLDGPEKIHDEARGAGTFQEVMDAIEICRKFVPVYIMSVVTQESIQSMDFLNEFSAKSKLPIHFQLVKNSPVTTDTTSQLLDKQQTLEFCNKILSYKKYNPYIAVSKTFVRKLVKITNSAVKHKKGFQLGIVKCWNGVASAQIAASGKVHSCMALSETEKALNLQEYSFDEAFQQLGSPQCETCEETCSIEYNLWLSFCPESVWKVFTTLFQSLLFNRTHQNG
jgi:MoaA/NifB/PqqE/SkfB family radical SAM enzyme